MACLALAGCGWGEAKMEVDGVPSNGNAGSPSPGGGTPDSGVSNTVDAGTTFDGGTAETGLPCDVAQVLASDCLSCHGTVLSGGAPIRLVTREDLLAQSPAYPGQTIGERAVARMKSVSSPMPPQNPPSAADVSVIESWVNAGMPAGSCGGATDGGTPVPDAGTVTPPVSVCTSNTYWTSGNNGSSSMNPGLACISCHSMHSAPTYSAAGTVFPTVREPDLCNGANGITVEITDNAGGVHTAITNSAGNFRISGAFPLPYTARVLKNGQARAMATPQMSGDCNSCHTENGTNGAPGRIVAP